MNLFSFDNVLKAHIKSRSNKLYRDEVYIFEQNLYANIQSISDSLENNTYQFGPYSQFMKTDTKRRLIVNSPYDDRVVHWLLYDYLYPVLDKTFIFDSYANRVGKGTVKGAQRAQTFLKKKSVKYILKHDFSKYFYSVHHQIMLTELNTKLSREFKNDPSLPNILNLLEKLVSSYQTPNTFDHLFASDSPYHQTKAKGMPIGSLFSQLMANVYLNKLDHYCKDYLGIKYYLRYVDDLVIMAESKSQLHEWKVLIENFCSSKLALTLHPHKMTIFPKTNGLDFLGYRIWDYKMLVRKITQKNLRKVITIRNQKKLASYYGILAHSDSPLKFIVKSLMKNII
jgi:RNA-directed DNA polymerase